MPPKSATKTRFFQLVLDRQFAEANRMLERIEKNLKDVEWDRGYLRALEGMILMEKSGKARYTSVISSEIMERNTAKKHYNEFKKQMTSSFHADYDRGFFAAWSDFMKVKIKTTYTKEPRKTPS